MKGISFLRMNKGDFSIRQASWQQDRIALRRIRDIVFVQEQQVPRELEWDQQDATAIHFLAEDDNGNPIGTARLLRSGQIGRMAVLKEFRGNGVGARLLAAVIEQAVKAGYEQVFLHAQVSVIGFYERSGFVAEGQRFMDAGIEHQAMRLVLQG